MAKLIVFVVLLGLVGCSSEETVRSEWWVTDPPEGSDFEIVAHTGWDGCDTFDRIEVTESDERVEIRTFFIKRDGTCTAAFTYGLVPVSLAEPIGNRTMLGCVRGTSHAVGTRTDASFGDCRDAVRPDVVDLAGN